MTPFKQTDISSTNVNEGYAFPLRPLGEAKTNKHQLKATPVVSVGIYVLLISTGLNTVAETRLMLSISLDEKRSTNVNEGDGITLRQFGEVKTNKHQL